MKTLLFIWSLALGHCLAGPFFFGQQGVMASQSFAAWTPAELGSAVVLAWIEGSSLTDADGTAIATWNDLSGSGARRTVQGGDSSGTTGSGQNWLIGPYFGNYQFYDGFGFATAGPAVTTNFLVHSVSQFSASTPDSSHWCNGTLAGSITRGGESAPPGYIHLAATGRFAEPLNGDLYGVIVLSGTDTTNRQKCEGYLAWKVGIAASLDASHPYKSSPP